MGVPFLVYALAMPVDSELRCQGSHHQRSRRPVVSWVLHYYVQGGSDLLPLEEEQRIAEKQSHGLLLAVRSFALCQACVGRIFLFLMGDKGAVYLTLLAHTLYVPVACVRDYTSGELCMALLPEGTSETEVLETLLQKPRLAITSTCHGRYSTGPPLWEGRFCCRFLAHLGGVYVFEHS